MKKKTLVRKPKSRIINHIGPYIIYMRLSFPNRMNVQHVNLVEARIASAPGPVGCSPSQATQSTSSSLTRQLLSLRAVARLRMRRPSVYIRRTVVRISGPGGNATAGQLELVPSLCHPPQTAPRHTYVRQHLYAWVFSTVPDASCLLSLSAALGFRRASGHASFAPEAAGAFTLEDPQELADASCFCDSR